MELTISNEKLYQMFIMGARSVINEKNELNKINVFPVADGDTGTNLSSMMLAIIEKAHLGTTHHETMQSISDAALLGARGNSGIIFAQYICGMAESLAKSASLTVDAFSTMITNAVKYAYNAISNPVEGTMITLMKAWAHAVDHLKSKSTDVTDLIKQSSEHVKAELDLTPEKLEILKRNKVVDAGAKGFYHFVLGFVAALKDEEIEMSEQKPIEFKVEDHKHGEERPEKNRFCTEAYLKGEDINIDILKRKLSPLGDSLVVAGYAQAVRVHIHTDTPEKVFELLDEYGLITEQKVDDMLKQYEVANARKYKIALLTDTIADLPQSFVDEHQIHQYPINLMINNVQYFDKVTIKNERLYYLMDNYEVYPTSSQPNLKMVENYLSFLTTYYDEILILAVSSKMSGTYSVFEKAASLFNDKKIKVIDTLQNSGAEGLLVYHTALWIKEGLPFETIVSNIEDAIKRSKILVSVPTLKYMVRSGRLSKVGGFAGKVLNLKPVISIDETGTGVIFVKALSQKSSYKKIMAHIKKINDTYGIESYNIVHAKATEDLVKYQQSLKEITGKDPVYVTEISAVVAMNAGVGSIAVSYIRKDK
ncbi:MAG: DAK2 domain-containing protein [Acholeplasmataceae bacterium]